MRKITFSQDEIDIIIKHLENFLDLINDINQEEITIGILLAHLAGIQEVLQWLVTYLSRK